MVIGFEPESRSGRENRGWDLEKPPMNERDSWYTREGGETPTTHARGPREEQRREATLLGRDVRQQHWEEG